jgi:hypothetical protein
VIVAAVKYWTYILESIVLFKILKLISAEVKAPNELINTRTAEQVPLDSL